ncbi:MAG: KUP/HAK/KT family potassium transporter [Bacteroidetes bacterium]|nr:KUP/HAK/KT family potassium transporter [Bacteroidota bacterium]
MADTQQRNRLTTAGMLITLGIVFGDIGTSPLYVMRAILFGASSGISPDFILGALSCIIWTLTLQTTIKYVLITLKADNKGEGGIFSLYAVIRKKGRWIYIPAIIGGSTLLADGIITPSITVISAVEGLEVEYQGISVLPIAIAIITMLFIIQQGGTNFVGKFFGPIMFFWFLMLATLGFIEILKYPEILKSLNPYYAYLFLAQYPGGFVLLGAVFLCTTGADALYSDLGHCGFANIRATWVYVKIALVLNYLGQGAWVLMNPETVTQQSNPFYGIMPSWFLLPGIVIATGAAIIASQAMISGSFTIISEAIQLNFWPKMRISHPTNIKGQMYIPAINWAMFIACIVVVLVFRKSSNMEAAYGLSITLTMLMTTLLMVYYLWFRRVKSIYITVFLAVYLTIEVSFLVANLHKFTHGGWFTLVVGGILFTIMYVWFSARRIKKQFFQFVRLEKYFPIISDLKNDETVPKFATNLVYLTRANLKNEIESKILYSIINKSPKRADCYWFLHIDILDEPNTMEYKVETLIPNTLIKINFHLGFKVQPRINLYFRQVIEEMVRNNEIDILTRYKSLRKYNITSDFKFVLIDRIQNYDFDFTPMKQLIMDISRFVRYLGVGEVKAYGLDTSSVIDEKVPLILNSKEPPVLKRIG